MLGACCRLRACLTTLLQILYLAWTTKSPSYGILIFSIKRALFRELILERRMTKTIGLTQAKFALGVLISCIPMWGQFTFHSVSMAPPNNNIPIQLTGTAAGK